MQYLLTEEEYAKLVEAAKVLKVRNKMALQAFCTRVANEMPVDWGWTPGDPKKPWGCILTSEEGRWYCDSCPSQDLCPHEGKKWSK